MFRLIYHYFGLNDCKSCETLTIQLKLANEERERLLNTIIDFVKPETIQSNPRVIAPIIPKTLPWRMRKSLLENESIENARIIKEQELLTHKLEEELEIKEN